MTPTGFLPEDDQGAFFVVMQLPDAASIGRTSRRRAAGGGHPQEGAGDRGLLSIIGLNFIDNYSQPNAAFVIVTLKPFEERPGRSQSRACDHRAAGAEVRGDIGAGGPSRSRRRRSSASAPAAASVTCCEDHAGRDPKALAQVLRGLLVAANQDPKLKRVFSTFSASTPSIYLDIDRDKAQVLGVEFQ